MLLVPTCSLQSSGVRVSPQDADAALAATSLGPCSRCRDFSLGKLVSDLLDDVGGGSKLANDIDC